MTARNEIIRGFHMTTLKFKLFDFYFVLFWMEHYNTKWTLKTKLEHAQPYVSSDYRARKVLIRCTDISFRRLWDLPPHAWMRLCESELPGDWWRVEFEYWSEEKAIANCRNLRALGEFLIIGIKNCITTATNRWECLILSIPGSIEILEYKI